MSVIFGLLNLVFSGVLVIVLWKVHALRKEKEHEALQRKSLERIVSQRALLANEIAHDIKNPITAILCSIETLDLLIGDALVADHRNMLTHIKEFGDGLLRLLSDFIDITRAEGGELPSKPETVEIEPLYRTVEGLLFSSATRKRVTLQYEEVEGPIWVKIDPRHLKQVFFNLLHNAIKYSPERGEVKITVEQSVQEPFVSIRITDQGEGIEARRLSTIFDPYGQLSEPRQDEGLGLGLPLCKTLLELNSGLISIESQKSQGTCVELRIPWAPSPGLPRGIIQAVHDQSRMPLAGRRVLLIDQDEGSRDAVAGLLTAWGGVVDQTARADDVMSELSESMYDIVIIDDSIPALSLENVIRKDGSHLPILVASRATPLVPGNGKVTVVEKPLNGKRLLDSICYCISSHPS